MLPLFPTPYPDEILYSVLCRYHSRCGSPTAKLTNIELWGNSYGKKLFLPDNIGLIAAQIPVTANLTTEKLISDTTIYPLLKPFLTELKATALWNDMIGGNKNIYNGIGFSHVFQAVRQRLRYCGHCMTDDTEKYGEPYWHRLHQFPGICVCHKHGTVLTESEIYTSDIRNAYYPLLPSTVGAQLSFEPDCGKELFSIVSDLDWISQNSDKIGYYGDTLEFYDKWLRVHGCRDANGKTTHKKLAEALVDYYGQELLSMFDAYNSGVCSWTRKITASSESLQQPVLHILLMRFLAGSAGEFFQKVPQLKTPEYMPFGEPPYPCRNYVCEYNLKNVIAGIEVTHTHKGCYKATFICPHCGFIYRRKKPIPKEKQYTGQIDIVDYGRLWHGRLKEMLAERIPIRRIGMALKCDTRTVVRFGIELDYFPPEQYPKLRPYIMHPRMKAVTFTEQRGYYRKRWLDIIAANPGITRNELRMLDSKTDQWLHLNDIGWYEQHSPTSRKFQPKWANDDANYLERIEDAMNRIRDAPGRPRRISINAIGRIIADEKLRRKLNSGNLPKSKALVDTKVESHEDWQRRKLIWATKDLIERGEVVTVYKVRQRAAIEDKERKWDEFIVQFIIDSE